MEDLYSAIICPTTGQPSEVYANSVDFASGCCQHLMDEKLHLTGVFKSQNKKSQTLWVKDASSSCVGLIFAPSWYCFPFFILQWRKH